jgi:Tfp pilus assembly protein PilP
MGGSKGRDPFDPLVNRAKPGESRIPDPGIPGPQRLLVSTVRIDGVVRTPSGMIAVLTSPQNRTYFVREGQRIYDGTVERITLDSVTFRERGKDPFGNVVERPVTRRIYPRAGEQ